MQDPVSHDDRDADGTLDQANTQPNQDASMTASENSGIVSPSPATVMAGTTIDRYHPEATPTLSEHDAAKEAAELETRRREELQVEGDRGTTREANRELGSLSEKPASDDIEPEGMAAEDVGKSEGEEFVDGERDGSDEGYEGEEEEEEDDESGDYLEFEDGQGKVVEGMSGEEVESLGSEQDSKESESRGPVERGQEEQLVESLDEDKNVDEVNEESPSGDDGGQADQLVESLDEDKNVDEVKEESPSREARRTDDRGQEEQLVESLDEDKNVDKVNEESPSEEARSTDDGEVGNEQGNGTGTLEMPRGEQETLKVEEELSTGSERQQHEGGGGGQEKESIEELGEGSLRDDKEAQERPYSETTEDEKVKSEEEPDTKHNESDDEDDWIEVHLNDSEQNRQEREQPEDERLQRDRLEEERRQKERLERENLERELFEKEKVEREHVEKKKLEEERLEKEERERLEYERLEEERLEKERKDEENKRLEEERLEIERQEREHVEKERLLNEQLEKERLERERIEQERIENERLEKQWLEKEKARLEYERLEKERLERERIEKEKVENERLDKERLENERLELIEKLRLEKERLEKENSGKESLDQEALKHGDPTMAETFPQEVNNDEQATEGLQYLSEHARVEDTDMVQDADDGKTQYVEREQGEEKERTGEESVYGTRGNGKGLEEEEKERLEGDHEEPHEREQLLEELQREHGEERDRVGVPPLECVEGQVQHEEEGERVTATARDEEEEADSYPSGLFHTRESESMKEGTCGASGCDYGRALSAYDCREEYLPLPGSRTSSLAYTVEHVRVTIRDAAFRFLPEPWSRWMCLNVSFYKHAHVCSALLWRSSASYNGVILEAIREASFTNGALQIQRALNLADLSNS